MVLMRLIYSALSRKLCFCSDNFECEFCMCTVVIVSDTGCTQVLESHAIQCLILPVMESGLVPGESWKINQIVATFYRCMFSAFTYIIMFAVRHH